MAVTVCMGRRVRTSPPAGSSPESRRPRAKGTYTEEIAKLRRVRAALLRTCSECEDYLAHGDERRPKARAPEPID